jgi:rRNA maturation endonuclease Nob1
MTFNCPRCSTEFTKGTKFCHRCGCNLELEFIENPTCPKCKATYPVNTKFCVNDGAKLVRPIDLIPKCVICNTVYIDDIKFCPRDGGEVKIILTSKFQQPTYQNPLFSTYDINRKYPKASLGNRFLAAQYLPGFQFLQYYFF